MEIGIVVIGRNEGERLRNCLHSVQPHCRRVIYVDSGSTDGSLELAQSLGTEVVSLDLSIPFTAARARNIGWKRLLERSPQIEFIQFIDGDCELDPKWLDVASTTIANDPKIAIVCGRRRERFPDASIYNRLCDLEWNTPIGEAIACGGDALVRVTALQQVDGYRNDLIAGEEPEMCLRLRILGWNLWRLDAEMTLHDASMKYFSQWCRRAVRAGHAFAEVSSLHRKSSLSLWQKETRSNWFWGLLLPIVSVALIPFTWGLSLLLLLGYVLLYWRIKRRRKRDNDPYAKVYAFYCVLAKFPLMWGQWKYQLNRWFGRKSKLIEYK